MTASTSVGPLGLGVDAGLAPPVARELAVRCAALGYGSLWSNDEPGASGLETLAHFATGAPQLDLGVGVLPIDQRPPAQIATEIDRLGLDLPIVRVLAGDDLASLLDVAEAAGAP